MYNQGQLATSRISNLEFVLQMVFEPNVFEIEILLEYFKEVTQIQNARQFHKSNMINCYIFCGDMAGLTYTNFG